MEVNPIASTWQIELRDGANGCKVTRCLVADPFGSAFTHAFKVITNGTNSDHIEMSGVSLGMTRTTTVLKEAAVVLLV